MRLGHPWLAAPRGRTPVDAPDAIARDERPQVRELDPLAVGARNLDARERLRLQRAEQALERLAARIHLERLPALEPPLMDEQPEDVRRAEHEVADGVPAPALAAERQVDLPAVGPVEPDDLRVLALGHEALGQVEQQLEPADRALRPEDQRRVDRLVLEGPL